LRSDTLLVSIMHVNNEIGVIQDIVNIGAIVRKNGSLFHVDAVQSAGKLSIDVEAMSIDLLSLSAHKMHGPKGVGALYVRRKPRVRLVPIIHGSGHEEGLRSGTLPTHQIVGFGEACAIAHERLNAHRAHLQVLRDRLWQGLGDLPNIVRNGNKTHTAPHILNVSFKGVDGETLLMALQDIAVSSGAACNTISVSPSHVLKAIGLRDEQARATIRFSIGRFNTQDEIDFAISHIKMQIAHLHGEGPA